MPRRGTRDRAHATPGPGWAASALVAAVLVAAALTPAAHGAAKVAVRLAAAMQAVPRKAKPLPVVKASGIPFAGPAAVGALFSTTASGRLASHFCTASVVASPHKDLVLTAAHCVTGHPGTIDFVPGYQNGHAPYGIWTVSKVIVDQAWAASTDQDDDFAFLVVSEPHGNAKARDAKARDAKARDAGIQDVTGNELLRTTGPASLPVQVIGYPDGSGLPVTCQGVTSVPFPHQLQFDCGKFTDGTSGGPFLVDVDPATGDGVVMGVIGGYQRGGNLPQISYSAAFGSNIAALYQKAIGQS